MKKIAITMLIILSLVLNSNTMGQDAPPPPPSGHGETGNQEGGRAPIGSGLFILLGLGVIYGSKKIYHIKNKKIND